MVDMSATLIHHGREVVKASQYGNVIVGLTTDDEILKKKGTNRSSSFTHRKEVLLSIEVSLMMLWLRLGISLKAL